MRAWWCRESVPSVDCIKWIWDKKSKVGGHGLGQALPLQPPPRPFFQALFGDKYKMKMEEVRVQSPSSWESMSSCWRWFDVNLVRNLGGMQYTLRCCGHGLGLVLGYLLSLHSCLYARKPFTMGLEIIPFVGAGGRIFFFLHDFTVGSRQDSWWCCLHLRLIRWSGLGPYFQVLGAPFGIDSSLLVWLSSLPIIWMRPIPRALNSITNDFFLISAHPFTSNQTNTDGRTDGRKDRQRQCYLKRTKNWKWVWEKQFMFLDAEEPSTAENFKNDG